MNCDTNGCSCKSNGAGSADSIDPPELMNVRELGEEQLECTEENDELLQGYCAVFSSVVVLVHSLEAAAGCDLDCNVVAHRCHLLEERHIPVSPGTFNNTTDLNFSVAIPSCQQQFL